MGVTIQQGSANIPEVDDGLQLSIFRGMRIESHPEWKTESNNYGKPDNGDRVRFDFELVDPETGAILFGEDGDPITISPLTSVAFGERSKAYGYLKGLLTKAEIAFIDAKEPLDSDSIVDRPCNLNISHNEKGWPQVENVLPASKVQLALIAKAE